MGSADASLFPVLPVVEVPLSTAADFLRGGSVAALTADGDTARFLLPCPVAETSLAVSVPVLTDTGAAPSLSLFFLSVSFNTVAFSGLVLASFGLPGSTFASLADISVTTTFLVSGDEALLPSNRAAALSRASSMALFEGFFFDFVATVVGTPSGDSLLFRFFFPPVSFFFFLLTTSEEEELEELLDDGEFGGRIPLLGAAAPSSAFPFGFAATSSPAGVAVGERRFFASLTSCLALSSFADPLDDDAVAAASAALALALTAFAARFF